jgi:phosphopantothenate synthetase
VTVITDAFIRAAQNRARALGLTQHPVVVIQHPIASMGREQVVELARNSAAQVVHGLLAAAGGAGNG